MAKTTKTTTKQSKTKPVQAESKHRENRYLRAARIIIEIGAVEDIDLAELAVRADMSAATASHCWAAFQGITEALRDSKLLPAKKAAAKQAPIAPPAPMNAEETREPEPAEA
jgi:hypothetical protein